MLTRGVLTSIPGIILSGQYGLEEYSDGQLVQIATPFDVGMVRARQDLQTLYDETIEEDGVDIEDKNRSHVLHFRNAKDPRSIANKMLDPMTEIANSHNLQIKSGKMVIEVRIPGYDKGNVLEQLVKKLGRTGVVYAGDDHGDIAAMLKVTELRERGSPQTGYSIASVAPETPKEILAAANFRVPGPRGVVRFFRQMTKL